MHSARNIQYKNFVHFLQANKHPLFQEINELYERICSQLKSGAITQSFIHFLEYLEANKYLYTLIFRTFGDDAAVVEKELLEHTTLKLNHTAHFTGPILKLKNGDVVHSPSEFLSLVSPFNHGLWKDDFAYWRAAGETCSGGKPFPINWSDEKTVSIFFDDNVEKNIICVQSTKETGLNQEQMQERIKRLGRLVSVDTFKVCTDPDYFIKLFEIAYHFSIPAVFFFKEFWNFFGKGNAGA